MINFIFKIFAEMQIGNDAYPPIPKISVGLLKTKKKRDLKDEKLKLMKTIFQKDFYFLKGNDGKIIISIFFFLLKIYNLYYL